MYQKGIKQKETQNQAKIHQRLKVLEWKLKQKDEEIMLMLRRNKEVEMKYNALKEILQNQRQQNSVKDDEESTEDMKMNSLKGKRNDSLPTNPTLKSNWHCQTQSKKDQKKSQEMGEQERKISQFGLSEAITTNKWKNYKTYKFN